MTATENIVLPFLHISYRRDLGILFSRWSSNVVHRQLKQGYNASLQFAKENNAHYWLADIRMRNTLDSAFLDWLQNDFTSTLRSTLGKTTFIAYLLSPHQLSQLSGTNTEGVPVAVGSHLVYCFYLTETNALNWLNRARQLSSST